MVIIIKSNSSYIYAGSLFDPTLPDPFSAFLYSPQFPRKLTSPMWAPYWVWTVGGSSKIQSSCPRPWLQLLLSGPQPQLSQGLGNSMPSLCPLRPRNNSFPPDFGYFTSPCWSPKAVQPLKIVYYTFFS